MARYKWMILSVAVLVGFVASALSAASPDPGVAEFLKELYALRARALITGESVKELDRYYNLDSQHGQNAMAHELGRIQYMQSWAPARRLKVVEAETYLTNLRVKVAGDTATVSLIARTRLGYKYETNETLNQMGVGSWHFLQLVRQDGEWKVTKEFYLDAMGDEWTEPYVPAGAVLPRELVDEDEGEAIPAARGRLNRQKATEYAEAYCGAAWGCGNKADYNQRYRSYRNLGGDCANFASQVLTEGGGLKPDWAWRYDKAGSTCWVNAQAFTRYLANSGRATILARGTYQKVEPALSKLKPGDIVAYQRKGGITHVSVVTGVDAGGVPIVAAHTADRFRNPWDLGWDKTTIFWLLHLHD